VGEVPEGDYRIPIGEAAVARRGTDATVVAVGPMVQEALAAAAKLGAVGASIEVINLRTLRPIDFATILASVARTGRLVVAEADWPHYGVAATIVAETTRRLFDQLRHAPDIVAWPDHPVLASHGVEASYYPGASEIQSVLSAQLGIDDESLTAADGRRDARAVAIGPF
jgi:pyruvate dehydrogenase E1 component beta subunit